LDPGVTAGVGAPPDFVEYEAENAVTVPSARSSISDFQLEWKGSNNRLNSSSAQGC
jgi:hypothetical protein